jgi:hypothetical protein
MLAKRLTPILNVSDIQQSFAWFEKLGWKKGWDWVVPQRLGACAASLAGRRLRETLARQSAKSSLVRPVVRSLLRFRQLARLVVRLAVEFLYFLAKVRAVVPLSI